MSMGTTSLRLWYYFYHFAVEIGAEAGNIATYGRTRRQAGDDAAR